MAVKLQIINVKQKMGLPQRPSNIIQNIIQNIVRDIWIIEKTALQLMHLWDKTHQP